MYINNTNTNLYPHNNHNYYPYSCCSRNINFMKNPHYYESQYYSDGDLNIMNYRNNNNMNDINKLSKTQKYCKCDAFLQNGIHNIPLNSFYSTTANTNKNVLQNFNPNNYIFEKDISVDDCNNKNHCITTKNNIKNENNRNNNNYNYEQQMDEFSENYYNLNYEDAENSKKSKNDGNTVINITYDSQSSENDYLESNEQCTQDLKKPERHKKKFMGKYFLSEIKDKILSPFHICSPNPNLIVPNENLLHYRITKNTKGKKNRKPEIIVRY